jgi:hypothetical protein
MRTQRDVFRRIRLSMAPLLLLTVAAIGQTTTGSIVGTITDSSGGVVVQAAVTVTNMGTGTTYKLSTNDAGTYVATDLPVGTYSVVVEASGFKREASSNIVINVQDRVRRDFQMEVGNVTESVNVTSSTPLLQTDNSYQGQVIDSQRIQDLPLNGREFQPVSFPLRRELRTRAPGPSARMAIVRSRTVIYWMVSIIGLCCPGCQTTNRMSLDHLWMRCPNSACRQIP